MYKIRLEGECPEEKVIIHYSVEEGNYNHKVKYKINLTDKQYSVFEAGEEVFIEWEAIEDDVDEKLDLLIKIVEQKIVNNRQIIYSSKQRNDLKELEKAEKHFQNNKIILEFLKKYN